MPAYCGDCQGEPTKEDTSLQALPKMMRKNSKCLEEEQSENFLPFNRILSLSVYAFP